MSLKYRIAATIFALEIVLFGSVLWMTLGHSMSSIHGQIASTESVTLQLLGDLSRSALLTDEYAPSFWVLADAEGNEACVCTWQGRA